jgi:hypothetical protein
MAKSTPIKTKEAKSMTKHPHASTHEKSFQGRHSHEEHQNPAATVEETKPETAPESKPTPIDLTKEFPATLEEFNRSAVHVLDKATAAFERAKAQNPTQDCLSKMSALIRQFKEIIPEIDNVAVERRA